MKYGFLLIALAVSWPAVAEERVLSFDDVLKSAVEKSQELARIDATLTERLAVAAETRLKQNPTLDTEYRAPTNRSSNESEYELKVSQPLRPSDFGIRSELAALIRDSVTTEKKLALLEFSQGLTLTYAKTWVLQERRAVLESSHRVAKGILSDVRASTEKGFLAESDVAVFSGEVGLLGADIVGADADRRRALAELTRVSGAALSGARLLPPPERSLPKKADLVVKMRDNSLPAQQRSDLLVRIAAKQVELARLDRYPRFAPGLGYERTAEGSHQVTLGFSVDLPFFDRNQAARLRAAGEEQAARRIRDYATSGRLAEEADLLHDAAEALSEQRKRFAKEVIPARETALRAFRKQLEVGQGTTFLVAQAQRELTESRLRALDLWSQEQNALTELAVLLGSEL